MNRVQAGAVGRSQTLAGEPLARACVVGASGFAGALAAAILWAHPRVSLEAVTARTEAGRRLDDLYPRHRVPLELEPFDAERLAAMADVALVSYPHGAAVVRTILDTADLTQIWLTELEQMRTRLNTMRAELAKALPQLASVAQQTGMFALLPLSREAVADLRVKHGIYMVENGRMNIAGLQAGNLPRFAAALKPYL